MLNKQKLLNVRIVIGLAIVLSLSLYNTISTINKTGLYSPSNIGQDKISRYLTRFEPLKDTLQFHDAVGYVTQESGPYWFQSQYELAPTIVAGGIDFDLVIGNFKTDSTEKQIEIDSTLELIIDYGDGLRLYRGKGE